jgi:hypothetical protein
VCGNSKAFIGRGDSPLWSEAGETDARITSLCTRLLMLRYRSTGLATGSVSCRSCMVTADAPAAIAHLLLRR